MADSQTINRVDALTLVMDPTGRVFVRAGVRVALGSVTLSGASPDVFDDDLLTEDWYGDPAVTEER